LKKLAVPEELNVAKVRFGVVCPATQFRSDDKGFGEAGKTVRALEAVVLVTVVFKKTAVAPAGTPFLPVI
jgi:hypothetical protein